MGVLSRVISEAVNEGIDIGFLRSMAEACDGHDNPDERCPMRPQDGCACIWVEWQARPWWGRIFREAPIRPDGEIALRARIDIEIERQRAFCLPKDPAP